MKDQQDAPDEIVRDDRYRISFRQKNRPTLIIRATEDQEQRIRNLTPEQLIRFRHIMGG